MLWVGKDFHFSHFLLVYWFTVITCFSPSWGEPQIQQTGVSWITSEHCLFFFCFWRCLTEFFPMSNHHFSPSTLYRGNRSWHTFHGCQNERVFWGFRSTSWWGGPQRDIDIGKIWVSYGDISWPPTPELLLKTEIRRSAVEVGRLAHYLRVLYIPGGCFGFLPSTVGGVFKYGLCWPLLEEMNHFDRYSFRRIETTTYCR